MNKPLTKSLHTVTATVNVAKMMLRLEPEARIHQSPRSIAAAALDVLGYDIESFPADDATVAAIIKQISKIL